MTAVSPAVILASSSPPISPTSRSNSASGPLLSSNSFPFLCSSTAMSNDATTEPAEEIVEETDSVEAAKIQKNNLFSYFSKQPNYTNGNNNFYNNNNGPTRSFIQNQNPSLSSTHPTLVKSSSTASIPPSSANSLSNTNTSSLPTLAVSTAIAPSISPGTGTPIVQSPSSHFPNHNPMAPASISQAMVNGFQFSSPCTANSPPSINSSAFISPGTEKSTAAMLSDIMQDCSQSCDVIEISSHIIEPEKEKKPWSRGKRKESVTIASNDNKRIRETADALESRENSLRERERLLDERERDIEQKIRHHTANSSALMDLQAKFEAFRNQTNDFTQKARTEFIELIKLYSRLSHAHTSMRLLNESHNLGRLISQRDGHMISEVWHDGEQMRELKERCERLTREKDELETEKKRLSKRRAVVQRKKNNAATPTSENASITKEDDDKDGDFKRPAALNAFELFEADEVCALKLSRTRRDLAECEAQREALENNKRALIRLHKLRLDEMSSPFIDDSKRVLGEGRYVLMEMLGRGGFSEVHKAFDLFELRWVAVKIHQLNPTWNAQRKEGYTKHAVREYNIHRSLNHPRICRLYDVFTIDNNAFATVLQYCDGSDLDLTLKTKGVLTEREARGVIVQVFSALQYLNTHTPNIIHYDLKPGNILFHQGEVRLTDFGLSKVVERSHNHIMDERIDASIELTSQGAGTYWYLPPECFEMNVNGVKITYKVDIFSAGVILYQMLTGRKPFGHGLTPQNMINAGTMRKANGNDVEFPTKPSLHESTKEFIKRCLAHNPAERPDIHTIWEHAFFKTTFK